MFYYKVESSHWENKLEFKSNIPLKEGQCFKIVSHDGLKAYPTRFKITEVLNNPTYSGKLVEITGVDFNVEPF